MGFFKNLFSSKKNNEKNAEEAESLHKRKDVDFRNPEQRSSYIMDCLEQMEDGARKVELLTGEYRMVTDYLTDTEEIEALPERHKRELENVANQLIGYDAEMKRYRERPNRMSDVDYHTIRRQESDIEEGMAKMKEAEKYAVLIKKDLRKLDSERQAYEYRKVELGKDMENLRGMVGIFIVAYIFTMLILVFFQFVLDLQVFICYILATAIVAIACTIVAIKYIEDNKERLSAINGINKLIKLQNTVKIRYVNNRKLLEFMYLKYHVENAEKLEKLWRNYQHEKEARRQFIEAEAQTELYSKQLVSMLTALRIKYPDRWIFQTSAILDKREMVELRHELIIRRQGVRENIEANKKLSDAAREEIRDIAKIYPEYAKEILEMVEMATADTQSEQIEEQSSK